MNPQRPTISALSVFDTPHERPLISFCGGSSTRHRRHDQGTNSRTALSSSGESPIGSQLLPSRDSKLGDSLMLASNYQSARSLITDLSATSPLQADASVTSAPLEMNRRFFQLNPRPPSMTPRTGAGLGAPPGSGNNNNRIMSSAAVGQGIAGYNNSVFPTHADLTKRGQTIRHDDDTGLVGSSTGQVAALLVNVVTPAGAICEGEIIKSLHDGSAYLVKCPFPDSVLTTKSEQATKKFRFGQSRCSQLPAKIREKEEKDKEQEEEDKERERLQRETKEGDAHRKDKVSSGDGLPRLVGGDDGTTDNGNSNSNNNNTTSKKDDSSLSKSEEQTQLTPVPPQRKKKKNPRTLRMVDAELEASLETVARSVTPDGLTDAEVALQTQQEKMTTRRFFTAEFKRRDVLPFGFHSPSTVFNRVGRHTQLGIVVGWDSTFYTYQIEQRIQLNVEQQQREENLKRVGFSSGASTSSSDYITTRIISASLGELQLPPSLTRGSPRNSFRVGSVVECRRYGRHDLDVGVVVAAARDVTYTVKFKSDDVVQDGILHGDLRLVSGSRADRCGVRDRVLVGLMGAKRATVIQCYNDGRFRAVTDEGEQLLLGDSNVLSVRPYIPESVGCRPMLAELFDTIDENLNGEVSWIKLKRELTQSPRWVQPVLAPLNSSEFDFKKIEQLHLAQQQELDPMMASGSSSRSRRFSARRTSMAAAAAATLNSSVRSISESRMRITLIEQFEQQQQQFYEQQQFYLQQQQQQQEQQQEQEQEHEHHDRVISVTPPPDSPLSLSHEPVHDDHQQHNGGSESRDQVSDGAGAHSHITAPSYATRSPDEAASSTSACDHHQQQEHQSPGQQTQQLFLPPLLASSARGSGASGDGSGSGSGSSGGGLAASGSTMAEGGGAAIGSASGNSRDGRHVPPSPVGSASAGVVVASTSSPSAPPLAIPFRGGGGVGGPAGRRESAVTFTNLGQPFDFSSVTTPEQYTEKLKLAN